MEEELKKYLLPSPPRTPPKAESRKRKIALSGPEAQKRLKEGERLGKWLLLVENYYIDWWPV